MNDFDQALLQSINDLVGRSPAFLTCIVAVRYIHVCQYEESSMLKLFQRTRELEVEFCERCFERHHRLDRLIH